MEPTSDDEGSWVDDGTKSPASEDPVAPNLESRGYQLEMFEHSMRGNIIATMETGSGKTQIARLRIEAELQRNPTKRIWFMTPSVVLAQQQHAFLSSQLTSYAFRLITGLDNVQFWSSQDVWDAALAGQHGIVSTPRVLLDALQHAFVSMQDISLLVFDEAHHCVNEDPTSVIMRTFYHPLRRSKDPDVRLPHVLGLTASPMMRDQTSAIDQLEENLQAVCRAPTINLEEYRRFVHLPALQQLAYNTQAPSGKSHLLPILELTIANYNIYTDPTYLRLRNDQSLEGTQKFEKISQKKQTPVLNQLKALQSQAAHLEECLGAWAADRYISTCINRFDTMLQEQHEYLVTVTSDEKIHLHRTLQHLRSVGSQRIKQAVSPERMSHKALVLVKFLAAESREDFACVIFVKRRATAWALTVLLQALHELGQHNFFAFVGMSNLLRQSLADLADNAVQQKAFAEFRKGNKDVCIATEVLEEGVDVQACRLVICFDHPSNVKSFIQRRGRARHRDSRYIILRESADSLHQYAKWAEVEAEMKAAYAEQDRRLDELRASDSIEEECDWDYRVNATGAVLRISDARAHLQHFCTTLPRREGCSIPAPIFITDGIPGPDQTVSCTVVLPASLPSSLQSTKSRVKWRTEMMAKKDAAFQAYIRLHQQGLVTDNLLPPVPEKLDRFIEGRDAMYEVAPLLDPWRSPRMLLATNCPLYTHRLSLHESQDTFPNLQILLPLELFQDVDVDLYTSPTAKLKARVNRSGGVSRCDRHLAAQATKFLYGAVLKRKLPGIEADDYPLPHYLVPDRNPQMLPSWIQESQASSQVTDVDFANRSRSCIIRRHRDTVPYFYKPSDSSLAGRRFSPDDEIEVVRLSRQIDFLQPPQGTGSLHRFLQVEDCSVSGLDPGMAMVSSFLPSILHIVGNTLRALSACSGVLRAIDFTDKNLVASALTAPGAGQDDYQRLEYIGDSILKYMAVTNLFCLHPHAPESQLTLAYHRITNNARLQRAMRSSGLDAFFVTQQFSAHEWTLTERRKPGAPRTLSSKALADVVEAVIGAAYMDDGASGLAKVLKTIELFLPELPWRTPASAIERLELSLADVPDGVKFDRLSQVEALIGYNFNHKSLLLEALTHPTVQTGLRSYERLEFLGDAIVDFIVNKNLWLNALNLTEGQMSERKACFVNKDIMAFFTTKVATAIEVNEIRVYYQPRKVVVEGSARRVCLHEYLSMVPSLALIARRQAYLERYERIKDKLEGSLKDDDVFPWSDLYHLDSPKYCSDVLESIIGAVFVDSGAALDTCEAVLSKIGLMDLVKRAATEKDVIYTRPLVRLRLKVDAAHASLRVERKRRKEDSDASLVVSDCRLKLNGEEIATYMGASCVAEAEDRAAGIVLRKIENGELVLERNRTSYSQSHQTRGKQERAKMPGEHGDEIDVDDEGGVAIGLSPSASWSDSVRRDPRKWKREKQGHDKTGVGN